MLYCFYIALVLYMNNKRTVQLLFYWFLCPELVILVGSGKHVKKKFFIWQPRWFYYWHNRIVEPVIYDTYKFRTKSVVKDGCRVIHVFCHVFYLQGFISSAVLCRMSYNVGVAYDRFYCKSQPLVLWIRDIHTKLI